ncbi:uncharacterized protein G2W53_003078 [Senna tora]|uniref:Uncharacterized protein n=1 Tax=Senna tora TaxID=362788 RepID=A0A835CI31_9FABA|nr:uncharacterized protein G2W53_003078 [Senna tora]
MMARTKHTRRITLMDACYLQRMGRSPLNGGYSCNVSTLSSKSGSSVRRSNTKIVELLFFFEQVVPKHTYPSRDGFWQQCRKSQRWCYQMYRRRARRESMMLLLKVLVTSIEGVDDSPSYAVATSKEGVNDAASGDKHGRC